MIVRGIGDLTRFIISGCNHNNICHADKIVLMADSKEKLKDLFRQLKKARLTVTLTVRKYSCQ